MTDHRLPILRRRSVLQMGIAAGAIPLLGTGARAQAKPKPSGQVVVGISQEPTVFLPLLPHIEVDDGIYMSLFSPLWAVDPKGDFLPRLATEIPSVENGGVSADGLSWRIKLRGDVTWHDGKPFTAEDVKFTLDLLRNPDFPAGQPRRARAVARHHRGFADRDHLADGDAVRALRLHPGLDVAGAEAPAGRAVRPAQLALPAGAGRHGAVQVGGPGARRSHHPGGERGVFRRRPVPGARGVQIRAGPDGALHAVPHGGRRLHQPARHIRRPLPGCEGAG